MPCSRNVCMRRNRISRSSAILVLLLLPFLYANVIQRTQLVVPGSSPGASKLAPLWSYPKSPGDLGAVVATTGTTSSVTARQGEGPPAKCCNWHSRRGRPRSHTPDLRTCKCAHPGRDRPDVNHIDDITGSMGRSVPLSPASLPRVALCFPAGPTASLTPRQRM